MINLTLDPKSALRCPIRPVCGRVLDQCRPAALPSTGSSHPGGRFVLFAATNPCQVAGTARSVGGRRGPGTNPGAAVAGRADNRRPEDEVLTLSLPQCNRLTCNRLTNAWSRRNVLTACCAPCCAEGSPRCPVSIARRVAQAPCAPGQSPGDQARHHEGRRRGTRSLHRDGEPRAAGRSRDQRRDQARRARGSAAGAVPAIGGRAQAQDEVDVADRRRRAERRRWLHRRRRARDPGPGQGPRVPAAVLRRRRTRRSRVRGAGRLPVRAGHRADRGVADGTARAVAAGGRRGHARRGHQRRR